MAHLNVYVNGTPGGTDGVLATTDTLIADGIMFPSNFGSTGFTVIPLCLRCDAGFSAQSVKITTPAPQFFCILRGTTTNTDIFTSAASMYSNTGWTANSFTNGSFYSGITVGNTNVTFLVLASGNSTLTTGITDFFTLSFIEVAV